jgi:ParB family transcriptional regulator, chromosome partitioning protein
MANPSPKLSLSPSRDIPFNKLRLSQSNVRRIKADISIDELAEDIARRGLLQSLNVRPIMDADRNETGQYECQSARKTAPRSASNIDPLVVGHG